MTNPRPLRIVDAHQYFFDSTRRSGAVSTPHEDTLPLDLVPLLRERQVEQTVLIQAEPSLDVTEWALGLAAQTEFVGAAVTWVDVTDERVGDTLDRLGNGGKLRGVCLPVRNEPDNHWLLGDDVLRGLRAVADRNLSLDLLVEPRHIPSVGQLAERLPHLRIALDHIGAPFIAGSQREPWGVYMLNIAHHRNIVAKLSGLVSLDARPRWHVAHIRLFAEAVVRLFGYERMMFGSDWPLHVPVATYAEVIDVAVASAGPMTLPQQERLLAGTAREFYQLG